mmetsp:Transcript_25786/g.29378  ORF Transcript_25786/g.29378 Transcript_25786/m.29378 type:complete len:173 (-) Transcript_25786:295-813(-)
MHEKEEGTGKGKHSSSSSSSSRRRSRRDDDEECDSEIYDTAHRTPLRLAGTLCSPTPAVVANCGTTVLEFPSFIDPTTQFCLISQPRSSFFSFYSTSASASVSISGPTNSSIHQSRSGGDPPHPPPIPLLLLLDHDPNHRHSIPSSRSMRKQQRRTLTAYRSLLIHFIQYWN